MSHRFRNLVCILSLLILGSQTLPAQDYNPNHFSPYKILQALQNRHSDLIMLAAHRGIHAILNDTGFDGIPENSLRAIETAATQGAEIVEIDVRLTKDGVPILTHDSTWGRETNVGNNWGSCCFNPFGDRAHPDLTVPDGDDGTLGGGTVIQGPQESAGINPSVSSWSNSSVQTDSGGILLRDSKNFTWSDGNNGTWTEHPPTLQQALNYRKNVHAAIVYAIDVKDASALLAAWKVVATSTDVKGLNDCDSVFFKIDATNFPFPSDLVNKMKNYSYVAHTQYSTDENYLNFMPVFQTSHIRPTVNGVYGYGSEDQVYKAIQAYQQYPKTFGIEVNQKDPSGILVDTPTFFRTSTGMVLANFNLTPEQYVSYGDGKGYYDSAGYCCANSSDWYFNGSSYGEKSDTSDQRDNYQTQIGYLLDTLLTTDNELGLAELLQTLSLRNTSYYVDNSF